MKLVNRQHIFFLFVFVRLIFLPGFAKSQTVVTIPLDTNEKQLIDLEKISGLNSNLKVRADLRNLKAEPIVLRIPAGMVILAGSENEQNMIVVHEQEFFLPPESEARLEIKTACLEPWKFPPDSASEKGMFFFSMNENDTINHFIQIVRDLENEISAGVESYQDGKIQFGDLATFELLELAQHCRYSATDSVHFSARIDDQVLQCALWQLTDKISLEDFKKILKPKNSEEERELRDVAEMAQILLVYGGLKPTIVLRRMLPLMKREE